MSRELKHLIVLALVVFLVGGFLVWESGQNADRAAKRAVTEATR